MAAPRCVRSSFGIARRLKVPSIQPFRPLQRRAASDEVRNEAREEETKIEQPDPELRAMEVSVEDYKMIQRAAKRSKILEKEIPRDREEASKRWKELQRAPDHENLLQMWKEVGVEPLKLLKERKLQLPVSPTAKPPVDPEISKQLESIRQPRNVQAIHLRPLRRAAQYGVPVCDLQLRTYSIRNIEFFADFAMRAAYYLGLPARGPVPLPKITERWTVPRANFIFKKSQENFERITMRRLIQIQDGHPDVVRAWLAFLQKHQYYGVGMKANVWDFEGLDIGERMDREAEMSEVEGRAHKKTMSKVEEILRSEGFVEAMKGKGEAEVRA
ncbi:ribosomal protein S10 [Lepidopterella palustris CBS 459.81]|uniref:Small ribosomal subunit protein uS10m n=1 Tax=Lepidopterella palustris CBS 459.81 TaxID=1314670 RepID=A0A8E2EK74_9PEZI|nr:ribosomal protein S10 [Lepidopterella palustris CBS 459.81]